MAWSVKISNTARNVVRDSLSISDNIDLRSTASFTVETDTGVEFARGNSVEILDDITPVFKGQISSVEASVTPNDPIRYHRVTAVDWHDLVDRRIIAASYQSQTAGFIVRALITSYFAAEGIAEDVGSSSISNGPVVEEAVFNYISGTQALDALADLAGYHWWIDVDKYLWFVPRTAVVAPWTLTWADVDGPVPPTISKGATQYRNTQYVKGGTAETEPQIESFAGDGERITFNVGFPLALVPTITLNAGAQTVGIRGLDSGKNWYWNKGHTEISQDDAGTTLTGTDVLQITYVGSFSIVAKLQDSTEVARMVSVEGATSGQHEFVEDVPQATTRDAVFQYGGSLLGRHAVESQQLTFSTIRSGLKPGQLITVDLPEIGLNDEALLISEIQTTDLDGTVIIHDVSAVYGPYDSWVKLFNFMLNRGQSFVLRENIDDQGTLALLSQFSEGWSWGEGVVSTVHSCPVPNTTLYPSTTLYPC